MQKQAQVRAAGRSLILLDMDGTLYRFRGGSFKRSELRRIVQNRARVFVARRLRCSERRAGVILKRLAAKYGEHTSVALEAEYGISRKVYFSNVWDINPHGLLVEQPKLVEVLRSLAKRYTLALVTDAPRVWAKRVLASLGVARFFRGRIFDGEGDQRKGFGNALAAAAKGCGFNPRRSIVVGDQEETDIMPAKRMGAMAVLLWQGRRYPAATVANYTIRNFEELDRVLQ